MDLKGVAQLIKLEYAATIFMGDRVRWSIYTPPNQSVAGDDIMRAKAFKPTEPRRARNGN